MALIRCIECGKEISSRAKACPNCGCPLDDEENVLPVQVQNANVVPVSDEPASRDEVVKHITYAAKLERTIFTYQQARLKLAGRISTLGHKSHIVERSHKQLSDMVSPILLGFIFFVITVVLLSLSGGNFFADVFSVITVVLVFFNTELLAKAGIALGVGIGVALLTLVIELSVVASDKSQAHAEYENNVARDRQRVAKEAEMITRLESQQSEIDKQLSQYQRLLKQLYDLNIIYPTYRHMVAVTTILQYFQSGRCNRLTGSSGAYNIYSYEEKQEIIIGKLDKVINMLGDIRAQQSLLYDAILDARDTANRIYAQSERMLASQERLAQNVELANYNAKAARDYSAIAAYVSVFG